RLPCCPWSSACRWAPPSSAPSTPSSSGSAFARKTRRSRPTADSLARGRLRAYIAGTPRHRCDAEAGSGTPGPARVPFEFAKDSMDADLAAVTKLIEPEVKALGFDLVRVAMIGGKSD